jgi:hypothetical protein
MDNHTRIIHTTLYGDKAFEILDGMRGQLSDGKWENSPGYDKYWTNFSMVRQDDGETVFVVNTDYCVHYGKYLENPFRNMSEQEFKSWCARKIKAVIKDELKHRALTIGTWNRRNLDGKSIYLGHSDVKYGQIVSVADIYCTYEALLGRDIGIAKYDTQTIINVFGSKRSEENTAKITAAKTAIASLREKYSQKREALQQAKNEAIAKLEKDLHDNIIKLTEEENTEIAKLQNSIVCKQ